MELNERWLWLGDTLPLAESGVTLFRAYPGAWWLSFGSAMVGTFDARTVLRAVRVACTPTIDGCEHGPHKLAVHDLSPRRTVPRRKSWSVVTEPDLPPSITFYDREGLEPISGCKTTFDAFPRVEWEPIAAPAAYAEELTGESGRLLGTWNVHPRGSLIFTSDPASLESGFAIVDLPPG